MTARDTYFELTFAPSIELVSVVRRFVAQFYERMLIDAEIAQRVALAAHELLENAVKYSSDGETSIRLDVRTEPVREFVIRTRNRATPDNVAILRARLAELNGSGDVDAHYLTLLRRSAKIPATELRGGLGLGRVASEAEMDLVTTIDEITGQVDLIARTRVTAGAR